MYTSLIVQYKLKEKFFGTRGEQRQQEVSSFLFIFGVSTVATATNQRLILDKTGAKRNEKKIPEAILNYSDYRVLDLFVDWVLWRKFVTLGDVRM